MNAKTVLEACSELSGPAFVAWMRLLIATDAELARFKHTTIGLGERRARDVLAELYFKGYVRIDRVPRKPVRVEVLTRCLLAGRDRFIKF